MKTKYTEKEFDVILEKELDENDIEYGITYIDDNYASVYTCYVNAFKKLTGIQIGDE